MAATLTDSGELTYFSFPIDKTERTADGDLLVYGRATDGSVDSDGQIVDMDWSGRALDEWAQVGNIRVQHQAQRDPAGKALEVVHAPDAHYVKSLIVEPVAKRLVEKGVLTAYSVGIARPVIEPDISGRARGGIIKGGTLVELSLVDRPANKNCGIQLVKSENGTPEWVEKAWGADLLVKAGTSTPTTAEAGFPEAPEYEHKPEPGTEPTPETEEQDEEKPEYKYKSVSIELPEDVSVALSPADLAKLQAFSQELGADLAQFQKTADAEESFLGKKHRKFSASRRRSLASGGNALPDGSYPIPDKDALRRAAILARSGHGDVASARRLIARRARELNVPNPLNDSDAVKKGDEMTDSQPEAVKTVACDACKGTGMIDGHKCMKCTSMKGDESCPMCHGTGRTDGKECPRCHGSGKISSDSDSAEKGINRMNRDDMDADSDADEDDKGTDKSAVPTAGVTGMHSEPVPAHREPDGSAIESFEHDAGMPSVPDSSVKGSLEDQAALRLKTIGIAYQLGALHDMTCPVYAPEDVAKAHPGMSFADIDVRYFAEKAMDAAAGAPMKEAADSAALWSHAQTLKSLSPAAMTELQAEAHKAFRDANPGPSSFPTPGHITAQRYNRGPITAGHAAYSPQQGSPNTAHVPSGQVSASQFSRGPITSGHADASPGNKGAGVPSSVNYVPTIQDNARQAMRAMHDHIAQTFPDVCCCGPEEVSSIARNPVPTPQGTPSASALKTEETDVTGVAVPEETKAMKKLRKKMGKRVLSGKMTVDEARARIGRRVAQKAGGQSALGVSGANSMGSSGMKAETPAPEVVPVHALQEVPGQKAAESPGTVTVLPPGMNVTESEAVKAAGIMTPDVVKAAMAEMLTPLMERLAAQERMLSSRLDALENLPDPSVAPYRGVAQNPAKMASARSVNAHSVAEIAERSQSMMFRELEAQWRTSPDPAVREAAWRSIQKLRGLNQV